MSKSEELTLPLPRPAPSITHLHRRASLGPLWTTLGLVLLVFALPLYRLVTFALHSELFSYILLIPCVSAYIVWRERLVSSLESRSDWRFGASLLVAGAALLALALAAPTLAISLDLTDELALTTVAFLLSAVGAATSFLGRGWLRQWSFPLGLLLFCVPIPTGAIESIEHLMQHGSAAVAEVLFGIFGTPVFFRDLTFELPGITLRVAPECSGLRSTLVLLIVSVVAGYFFLRSPARRAILAAAVVPLALARNGFRIFTVSELCVRQGPEMIDSYIHRHGGPVFFGLSLVPFFLLVVILQRRERASASRG
jgi:exosortase C (VPDSG-CTERM-specific)